MEYTATSRTESDIPNIIYLRGSKCSEEDIIKNGQNALHIVCQSCKSMIITPGKAAFVVEQHFLPYVKSKSNSDGTAEGEVLPKFWQVDDIYTFDNVGFSNAVGSTKYLACADCEIGPIGMFDTTSQISYIAIERVDYF